MNQPQATTWFRRNRWRMLRWSAFILMLAGLGWGLDDCLPPEPRWSRREQFDFSDLLPGSTAFAMWRRDPATGQRAAPLTLLDLGTGESAGAFFAKHGADGTGIASALASSRNGRVLAFVTGDGKVRLADTMSGEEWRLPDHAALPAVLNLSGDGAYLIVSSGGKGSNRLVESRSGRLLCSWSPGWAGAIFSRDSDFLLFHESGPEKQAGLRIFDLRTHALVTTLPRSELLHLSDDGKTAFAAQKDGNNQNWDRVVVLDVPTGRQRGEIGAVAGRVLLLTTSRDERIAAVWSESTGSNDKGEVLGGMVEFWDVPAAKRLDSAAVPFDCESGAFSPDGRVFALMNRTTLVVLDPATARESWRTEAFAWQPNEMHALFPSDSSSLVVRAPQQLRWLDIGTGAELYARFQNGQYQPDTSAGLHHDRIAAHETAGWSPPPRGWFEELARRWLPAKWLPPENHRYGVYVLDTRTRRTLFELFDIPAHRVMLSDDGNTLLTIHANEIGEQELRCWDVPAHKPLRWVLGVPLSLAATVVAANVVWRRWRRRATA